MAKRSTTTRKKQPAEERIELTDEQYERVARYQRDRDKLAMQLGVALLQLLEGAGRTRQLTAGSLKAQSREVEKMLSEMGYDPDDGEYVLDDASKCIVKRVSTKE